MNEICVDYKRMFQPNNKDKPNLHLIHELRGRLLHSVQDKYTEAWKQYL